MPEAGTGNVMLTFYLEAGDGLPIPANTVVQHLRTKFQVDASLLGFSVSTLQTSICQNNCSGHGVCNEVTRSCECEVFWMHVSYVALISFILDYRTDCQASYFQCESHIFKPFCISHISIFLSNYKRR